MRNQKNKRTLRLLQRLMPASYRSPAPKGMRNPIRLSLGAVPRKPLVEEKRKEEIENVHSAVENLIVSTRHQHTVITICGIEGCGKSTMFKQMNRFFKAEEFEQYFSSDAFSQVSAGAVRVTMTVLRLAFPKLVAKDSKKAAQRLYTSRVLYSLSPKIAEAIETLWRDSTFLNCYVDSSVFQGDSLPSFLSTISCIFENSALVDVEHFLRLQNPTFGASTLEFSLTSLEEVPESEETEFLRELRSLEALELSPKAQNRKRLTNIFSIMGRDKKIDEKSFGPPAIRTVHKATVFDVSGMEDKREAWEYYLRQSSSVVFVVSLLDVLNFSKEQSEICLEDSVSMFKVLCESDFLEDKNVTLVCTKRAALIERVRVWMEQDSPCMLDLIRSDLLPTLPIWEGLSAEEYVERLETFVQMEHLAMCNTQDSFLKPENIELATLNTMNMDQVKELTLDVISASSTNEETSEPSVEATTLEGSSLKPERKISEGFEAFLREEKASSEEPLWVSSPRQLKDRSRPKSMNALKFTPSNLHGNHVSPKRRTESAVARSKGVFKKLYRSLRKPSDVAMNI